MDDVTVSLMMTRESARAPWEVHWAVLDELHEDPVESGSILVPVTFPGLYAMRMGLGAAWRAVRHLHV